MDRLMKRLFIATHKQYRQWLRMEDNMEDYAMYTDMERLAVRTSYQTLYRFIVAENLEDKYLEWVASLGEDEHRR